MIKMTADELVNLALRRDIVRWLGKHDVQYIRTHRQNWLRFLERKLGRTCYEKDLLDLKSFIDARMYFETGE
jgi:hypothetical protein